MAKNTSQKRPVSKAATANRKNADRSAPQANPPAGAPSAKSSRQSKPANKGQPLRSRPANENEPGTAALISRMRKRPSSAPLWVAFLASMLWVFGFFALFTEQLSVLANPLSAENMPRVLIGAMVLFLPIFLSFSAAYFLWRAQQMRHVSEGLVHTAMRLIRPQEVAADGLMSISQSIRYDVDQLVGGIEHAMARAGELEGMVHREISNIERAFGSNEERIRTLLSGLENQRNALREAGEVISKDTAPLLTKLENNTSALGGLVNTATSTLSNIDEGLKSSSSDLSATVEDFSNRANIAGKEFNTQSQRMDQMSGVMVNEMRIFSESLSTQIDALATSTTKINKESGDFSQNVHNLETKVLAALKTSGEELGTVNADVLRTVERMTGTLSEQLTGTSSQFSDLLQSTSSNLTYHLQSTSAEVAKAMERSGIDVSQQIETSGVALSDKLLSVSGDFVGNVAQARDDLYTYLEDVSGKMTGRLSESTKALYTEVESSTNDISNKLEQTSSVLFGRVAEATGQMSAHLDESTSRLSGSIDETSTQMVQRLETSTSRLSQLLDVASSDMTNKLEDTTTQLAGRLDKSSGEMASNLSETSNQITGQLDTTASDLASQLDRTSGNVADQLASTAEGLATKLDKSSGEVANRLASTTENVTGQLEITANDLASNLEATTASVTQYFSKTTGEVTTQLADTSTKLLAQLDDAAGDMTIRLNDTTGKLSHQLDAVTDGMTGKLSDTTVRLTEQLSVAAEDMTSKLTDSTASVALRLDNTSIEMTGLLASTTGNLTDKLDKASFDLAERLDLTTNQFHTQLDGVSGTMLGRIESTVSDLGKRFDVSAALLEDVTGNITRRFDGTSDKFTKILGNASSQILDELGNASTAFSDGLKLSTDEITGRFEETTGALAHRVDKATEEIEGRTNAASRRLEEAGMKFSGHVEKANSFLSEKLETSAKSMDNQIESISTELTGRLETTGERIAKHLGTSSAMVERAVDHFTNNMDKVVHVREEQMDDLVKMLANKAEDVDMMMRNYVSVMEDSLNNAHGKSDDIVRLLTAQSGAAASNLQTEIARIEATSDEQIAKAAQALGQQYEAVIGSLNNMLASSTNEFADTAQTMRTTAQQVAKDIDFARNELRRTILDLPDETRNNADAMRRVVSDQITALNALADVVKRQTGLLDISGPGVSLAPDGASPGKPEGAPSARQQTRGANPKKPVAAKSSMPVASDANTQSNALQLVRSRPAVDPIKSKAQRGSADLLPQITKQQSPAHKSAKSSNGARLIETLVSKLNSAARDLTEAFEDRLPNDLERQYNNGQAHVYTHRLYLARGQKMYNMVKQGYTNERLIRGRVDAYIRLFERLLDTLSESPQGSQMVDASLSSESGKLYLLFAQSADRLKT